MLPEFTKASRCSVCTGVKDIEVPILEIADEAKRPFGLWCQMKFLTKRTREGTYPSRSTDTIKHGEQRSKEEGERDNRRMVRGQMPGH